MTHVFIIRHGETEYNRSRIFQGRSINASLNETGRSQAEAVCEVLSQYPITKIVTSTLIRTLETAEPLIELRQPLVESYTELDEMDFGDLEGQSIDDHWDEIKNLQQVWEDGKTDHPVPGGESPDEVYERAATKLIEVLKNSQDEYIAFYLHGRLIRILLSGLLGIGLPKMQNIQHKNGSVNHLTWDGVQLSSLMLNMTTHLESIEVG